MGLCAKDKLVEVAHTAHTAGVAAARQGHTGNNSPRIAWVAQHLVQDLLAKDSRGKSSANADKRLFGRFEDVPEYAL